MKRTKLFTTLTTSVLVFSLVTSTFTFVPKVQAETQNSTSSKAEYSGEYIDGDGKLDKLFEDSVFAEKAKKSIKEQAAQINFDETLSDGNSNGSGSFTYDGGTKVFLNMKLKFKPFTLRSVGKNIEIWVANDMAFPEGDSRPTPVVTQEQVDKFRDEFDNSIYPKDTEFFGTPDVHDGSKSNLSKMGVVPEGYYEGSDKVIMLVDNIIDESYYDPTYPGSISGFFSYTLEDYSDRNIITMDSADWERRLGSFYGVAMHELQHLIHWDNDGREETWLNEGMSCFAQTLGGYKTSDRELNFLLDHPENSLVNWDEHKMAVTGPETGVDYALVYLFTMYMNDKLGRDFIRDLAVNKNHGIDSINEVLKAHGSDLTFTKLYQNFITALVLDTDRVGGGVYKFDSINLRDLVVDEKGTKRGITVNFEKALEFEKQGIPAWGGDFKQLDFKDKIRSISFNGIDFLASPWKAVVDPKNPDNKVLWGNNGNEADNKLVLTADLTNTSRATLKFDNLIDIEEQWDFGVVQVSTDNGQTWSNLANENTRSDIDPTGYPKIAENLPGFTGTYEGWKKESFDLSPFAGQKVLICFRYLTDWNGTNTGWFIDNVEIPEIGFYDNGNSTDAFKSMQKATGQDVKYTVTFINEREVGNKNGRKTNYKVITVDPFNITEQDALQLRQLFQDGKNYMITTYAAPAGDQNPVEFSYEVNLKKTGSKK